MRFFFCRPFIGLTLGIAVFTGYSSTAAAAANAKVALPMFSSETAAQEHCPGDTVVWLNLPTKIYHEKGMLWYGHTAHGAYVCRKEADIAGNRNTPNGK